jgi:hypothetical protein
VNEDVKSAIELLDRKFGKVEGSINERIADLIGFRELVSKKIKICLKEVDDLKDIFKRFSVA